MIQVYSPSNTNYTKNGDAVLLPIECKVEAQLNGAWTLSLLHPIDEEGRWKLIEVGAVIKAPSFNGEQLFRIRQTEKADSGITVTAEPIFLDAIGDCFLLDVRPTNRTGQQALNDILASNNKYSGTSNITTRSTAYYVNKNALEAISGSEDNSFLNRWGGEILYNNYQIIINTRAGGDYGVKLLYAKNIPVDGMREAINMDGVVTRIIPKAFNGYTLSGNTPWVDSPLINTYPTVMTSVVEYEHIKLASDVQGEAEEGTIVCNTMQEVYAALRTAASEEFTKGIDKPTVSIEADMVMLQNTVEYADYKDLEEVSLGDTIHCKHSRLGIITDSRVVGLVYDCTRKAVESVVIGEAQPSFMDRVASTVQRAEKAITRAGAVKGDQIEGFINGALAQLRLQNTVAEKQDVFAILFEDLDPDSPTFGALAIGTQGLQISRERTADDRAWVWTTAATSEGIFANTLIAQEQLAVAKHFFADANGVHVTEDESDYTQGNNVLIDGNSVDIRQGEDTVASFGQTVVLGNEDDSHMEIDDNEMVYIRRTWDDTDPDVRVYLPVLQVKAYEDEWMTWETVGTNSRTYQIPIHIYDLVIKKDGRTTNAYTYGFTTGIVTFSSSVEGVTLTFSYKVTGQTFIMGHGAQAAAPNQVILGEYNAPSGKAVIQYGKGYWDGGQSIRRSNLFELDSDGYFQIGFDDIYSGSGQRIKYEKGALYIGSIDESFADVADLYISQRVNYSLGYQKVLYAALYAGVANGDTPQSFTIPSSSSWYNVIGESLEKGRYYVKIFAAFSAAAGGVRLLGLGKNATSAYSYFQDYQDGTNQRSTTCEVSGLLDWPSAGTAYINVRQNSGADLNVSIRYTFYKIG